MNTGYGWACQPVVPFTAYSWRRTTTSIGPLASALNRPPLAGFDITLKLSKLPRARIVGTTPDGADAEAIAAPIAMTASAPAAIAVRNRIRRRRVRPPAGTDDVLWDSSELTMDLLWTAPATAGVPGSWVRFAEERRALGQGATRCQVGSLEDTQGAERTGPPATSRIRALGWMETPAGRPKIWVSSGDHIQAAQQTVSTDPAGAISTPVELPSAGTTAPRTSSNSFV